MSIYEELKHLPKVSFSCINYDICDALQENVTVGGSSFEPDYILKSVISMQIQKL